MKLIAKFDNGEEAELRELQGLNKDCEVVIVKAHTIFRPIDIENMEKELSTKLNKRVVLLDGRYAEIIGTL